MCANKDFNNKDGFLFNAKPVRSSIVHYFLPPLWCDNMSY